MLGATLDNVIEVSELPENVHEDKIWLYFKNPRSRGGELIENECVYRQEKRRAIVVFKDSAGKYTRLKSPHFPETWLKSEISHCGHLSHGHNKL